jgi:hypothetical protein
MFRKLWFLEVVAVMVTSMALPAWSGPVRGATPGTISGYVRDASGAPQMGAVVEVLSSAAQTLKVFTDDHGFYSARNLLPGTYSIKVSAPSFLPSLREKIGVRAGARQLVNITLTTLFEAIQLVPLRGAADDDDWKWTLRSIANRPILRVLPDGTTVVEAAGNHDVKGTVTLLAGSPAEGFGSPSDMTADFAVQRSLPSNGTLRLNGNVGYESDGEGNPAAVVRTSYTNSFNGMFEPSVAITALRLNSPDLNMMPAGTLQALSVKSSDRVVLGNLLELNFGSELQTIQFMGRVNAFKPFGSADLHLSPDTVVEYQYASSVPHSALEDHLANGASDNGLDSTSSDLSETAPRMSITGFSPAIEKAHHQEVSISHRIGKNNMQVAFYEDGIADPVLTGVGEMMPGEFSESGNVLPDIYSGTFSYQGNDFSTRGLRVVLQRKLLSDLTATLDYAYGGTLDLSRPDVQLEDARQWIHAERRQAVAAKLSGTVPKTKTRWVASYRYVASGTLTPVDLFNTSAGQADPYLNLCIRQPIPGRMFAGHMDFILDVRNLLAQGYVPVMGQDGHTLYLVQSARSARGGVAFSF